MATKIFTEEPEQELWRTLQQYSYKANIRRYFESHNISFKDSAANDEECDCDDGVADLDLLANSISGALLQAVEYYNASKTVSLQVEPLLLYYGSTNLFYALSILLSGRVPIIHNHGMRITVDKELKPIADTKIAFNDYNNGGVHIFANSIGFNQNLCNYNPWKLSDFLDSIAEIKPDFEQCYTDKESHILFLDKVETPNGMIEKIILDQKTMDDKINHIEGFKSAYLKVQKVHDSKKVSYVVLRHKINGQAIEKIAYSGQPYLQVAHGREKNLVTVNCELNLYIVLFVLACLCRYYPEIWNPFVTQDTTGERLLIEKFLYYARRMFPNFVLNKILGKEIAFVSEKYVPETRIHLIGEHEVYELVRQEVQNQLRKEIAQSVNKAY